MIPVSNTLPAAASSPQVKLPVASLIQPIMKGPANPPTLPSAVGRERVAHILSSCQARASVIDIAQWL
jgi:hypothetical protein